MVKYWAYHVEYEETDEKFISDARQSYGYDVPTFREALRDLFRSLYRTRLINKAIPDVKAAFLHYRQKESIGRTYHDGIQLREYEPIDNSLYSDAEDWEA